MTYKLGSKSHSKLYLVHPLLVAICEEAIKTTEQDFGIFEGIRTVEQEIENINNGTSWLKNPRDCKHCLQKGGYGWAVDAVPFIDGAYRWEWDACYKVAKAFKDAAAKFNTQLRWGGVWDKAITELSDNLDEEVEAYRVRHLGKDHLDGVHFELISITVPNNTINDNPIVA